MRFKHLQLNIRALILGYSIVLFLPIAGYAQIKWQDIYSKIELNAALNANVAFPLGKDVKHLKSTFAAQKSFSDSTVNFEGRVLPRTGFACGVEATYPLDSSWRMGVGLRYSQKGYVQKENGSFLHPEYQYDQIVTNRFAFRVNTWEIPIQMYWTPSNKFRLHSGISLGWTGKAKHQIVRHSYSKKVIINGEKDKNQSVNRQKETYSIADGVRGAQMGGLIGTSIRVRGHWWWQVSGQITTPLFKKPWNVYNIIAQTGLMWQL